MRRLVKTAAAGLVLWAGLLLVACQAGGYALECEGVERDECQRVATFGFGVADVATNRVHVQARSCSIYLDPVPDGTRCWSVRLITDDGRTVVGVSQVGDGDLVEATELHPIFPTPGQSVTEIRSRAGSPNA
jgi:hypothetical protein